MVVSNKIAYAATRTGRLSAREARTFYHTLVNAGVPVPSTFAQFVKTYGGMAGLFDLSVDFNMRGRKAMPQDPRMRNMLINSKKNIARKYRMPIAYPSRLYKATHTRKATRPKKVVPKKKPTNRKNKKNIKAKSPMTLQKQISQIAKKVNLQTSKHTYRYAAASYCVANVGECDHVEITPVTPTLLETYTDNLEFFNPAAPGTLTVGDPSAATYSHDIKFKNIHSKITVKNNFMVPANVKVYLCIAKSDQPDNLITQYLAGIADTVVTGGADAESSLVYLTDIERLREQWDIDCVIDKHLPCGHQASASHNTGEFNYDPSQNDSETAYQKQNRYFVWVVRVQGDLGHDSTNVTTEIGLVSAGVDIMWEAKAEILYDSGGVQLNRVSFNDQRRTSAFTNSGLTGVPVIPDNITITGG